MKTLVIQLQPERAAEMNAVAITERLRHLAREHRPGSDARVSKGDDNGHYVNVGFDTDDLPGLWSRLQVELRADATLARCSIVTCQGQAEWDDYLLLHHYDERQLLDELS